MIDILVVDDDPVFGELTTDRLEMGRWSAAFHQGPFGTVNAVRAAAPRLIILDVNMPGLDGTRIIELIRKTPSLAQTCVMLHSSLDQKELDTLGRRFHADAALSKSASKEQLMHLVEKLLARG